MGRRCRALAAFGAIEGCNLLTKLYICVFFFVCIQVK